MKIVHARGLGLALTFTFIQGVLHPFNITSIDALYIFYTLFYNLYFYLLRLCIHRSIQPLPSPIYFPVRKALYSWHKLFIAAILVTRVRTTLTINRLEIWHPNPDVATLLSGYLSRCTSDVNSTSVFSFFLFLQGISTDSLDSFCRAQCTRFFPM